MTRQLILDFSPAAVRNYLTDKGGFDGDDALTDGDLAFVADTVLDGTGDDMRNMIFFDIAGEAKRRARQTNKQRSETERRTHAIPEQSLPWDVTEELILDFSPAAVRDYFAETDELAGDDAPSDEDLAVAADAVLGDTGAKAREDVYGLIVDAARRWLRETDG